jgi:hypothetical protein
VAIITMLACSPTFASQGNSPKGNHSAFLPVIDLEAAPSFSGPFSEAAARTEAAPQDEHLAALELAKAQLKREVDVAEGLRIIAENRKADRNQWSEMNLLRENKPYSPLQQEIVRQIMQRENKPAALFHSRYVAKAASLQNNSSLIRLTAASPHSRFVRTDLREAGQILSVP